MQKITQGMSPEVSPGSPVDSLTTHISGLELLSVLAMKIDFHASFLNGKLPHYNLESVEPCGV
jgi:hypothetical protein